MSDAIEAIASTVKKAQDAQLKLRPLPPQLAFEKKRNKAWAALALVAATAAIVLAVRAPATTTTTAVVRSTTVTHDAIEFADGSRLSTNHASADLRYADDKGATIALEHGTIAGALHDGKAWAIEAGPYLVRTNGARLDATYDDDHLVVHVVEGTATLSGLANETLAAGATFDSAPTSTRPAPPILAPHAIVAPATTSSTNVAPTSSTNVPPPPDVTPPPPPPPPSPSWQDLARADHHADAVAAVRALGLDETLANSSASDLALLGASARLTVDVDVAQRAYATTRARFPGSIEAARAAFFLARIAAERSDHDAAIRLFRLYLGEAPANAPLDAEAHGRLVEELVAAQRIDEAKSEAQTYLRQFPHGAHADLAVRTLER